MCYALSDQFCREIRYPYVGLWELSTSWTYYWQTADLTARGSQKKALRNEHSQAPELYCITETPSSIRRISSPES